MSTKEEPTTEEAAAIMKEDSTEATGTEDADENVTTDVDNDDSEEPDKQPDEVEDVADNDDNGDGHDNHNDDDSKSSGKKKRKRSSSEGSHKPRSRPPKGTKVNGMKITFDTELSCYVTEKGYYWHGTSKGGWKKYAPGTDPLPGQDDDEVSTTTAGSGNKNGRGNTKGRRPRPPSKGDNVNYDEEKQHWVSDSGLVWYGTYKGGWVEEEDNGEPETMDVDEDESGIVKVDVADGADAATDGNDNTSGDYAVTASEDDDDDDDDDDEEEAKGYPNFGQAIFVDPTGGKNFPFPKPGSTLGKWYCLGTLGKGTFSSIHKVINLDYFYSTCKTRNEMIKSQQRRVAAAKVELADFANSGVLLGESVLLHFLHHSFHKKGERVVPVYLGHYKERLPEIKSDADNNQTSNPSSSQTPKQQQPPPKENDDMDISDENSATAIPASVAQTPAAVTAALVMEYLQGDDMHQIRENHGVGPAKRRLAVQDAVHFTARVLLPLLKQMHSVGLVHRDVKPSNVVRTSLSSKEFVLVDFGLSKSIIVPKGSAGSTNYEWPKDREWLRPPQSSSSSNNNATIEGCIREERAVADFRGTSMYASLRVHQGRDYSRRDDLWSLLYVFCDLISGGLPWMSHAANRDRDGCRYIKERVHGLQSKKKHQEEQPKQEDDKNEPMDETAELLKGDEYHVAKYKSEKSPPGSNIPVPEPLPISKDELKVQLLRQAFQHLARLSFYDEPDYSYVQNCILRFLENLQPDPTTTPIDWEALTKNDTKTSEDPRKPKQTSSNENKYIWDVADDLDPLDVKLFDEKDDLSNRGIPSGPAGGSGADAADAKIDDPENSDMHNGEDNDSPFKHLPLQIRYFITQMNYHVDKYKEGEARKVKHIILRDWMKIAIPLIYEEWDATKYESGGHRTNNDGYRREVYIDLIKQCLSWAETFDSYFAHPDYYLKKEPSSSSQTLQQKLKKKRNIICTLPSPKGVTADLVAVSRVIFGLQSALKAEQSKSFAAPPMLSFGSIVGGR